LFKLIYNEKYKGMMMLDRGVWYNQALFLLDKNILIKNNYGGGLWVH